MSPEGIGHARALLSSSLALWRVPGTWAPGTGMLVGELRTPEGITIRVESASDDEHPIRWWVRWATAPDGGQRSRPCTSAVGLLRTVRTALGVEVGQRLRIAPGPERAPGPPESSGTAMISALSSNT